MKFRPLKTVGVPGDYVTTLYVILVAKLSGIDYRGYKYEKFRTVTQ